jgi:hypothetical protein
MDTLTEQQILTQLSELDPFSRHELMDFLAFLRYRRQPIPEMPRPLPPLRGKYKHRLSPADEFARRKQAEIELENSKWER